MRYVLRADASESIGAGHVMRSSAIAEELIARGENVVFVGQISGLPWVEERIASLGFTMIHDYPSEFISKPESDVLILDSYEISINDNFIAPESWLHIVVIVDGKTPDYHCTLRIHPGLDSNWIGESKTPILSGPKYIPFRSSLYKNMNTISPKQGIIKIAVVAGGADPYGLVNEIAKFLVTTSEEFEVYLFSNSIFNLTLDPRFRYIEIGSQLDELTKNIDLVLTTASTSSLEFIARGLCVGVACAVDNQEQNYDSMGQLGVAARIGLRNSDNFWELNVKTISLLISSSAYRENLVTKSKGLIDFNGASRIVDAITTL